MECAFYFKYPYDKGDGKAHYEQVMENHGCDIQRFDTASKEEAAGKAMAILDDPTRLRTIGDKQYAPSWVRLELIEEIPPPDGTEKLKMGSRR